MVIISKNNIIISSRNVFHYYCSNTNNSNNNNARICNLFKTSVFFSFLFFFNAESVRGVPSFRKINEGI